MSYADDTEYAARHLVDLTMQEESILSEMKAKLSAETAKFKLSHWDFETSDLNDDFSDAHVMNAFRRMAEADIAAKTLQAEVDRLEASIGSKQVAVQAMCGALLQIVKQGISLVHGSLAAAPDGRLLNGIPLKDIVWQGRNQAIHFEDGQFSNPVTSLFAQLEQEFGREFALAHHVGQSRAKQIVMLLGWSNYATMKSDMELLGL